MQGKVNDKFLPCRLFFGQDTVIAEGPQTG
jgi:hypothetical protein